MLSFICPSIDPVAFHIFNWPIRWYGLSYVAAFVLTWFFMKRFSNFYFKKHQNKDLYIESKHFDDILTYCILGIIIGARLGHMVFYDFNTMIQNPLSILKTWEGGMAFHGGLIGCVLCGIYYIRKHKLPLPLMADIMSLVTPIGIFCVRIANFVNQELYGRVTASPLGMIFQNETDPRHPSQLYEAFLEGILLFLILYYVFKYKLTPKRQGLVCAFFFLGYGIFRYISEYFREPSDGVFMILNVEITYGQLLTLPMILIGLILSIRIFNRKAPVFTSL